MKLIPSPLAQAFHSPVDRSGSRRGDLFIEAVPNRHWPADCLASRATQAQAGSTHDWDEHDSVKLDDLLKASCSADLGGGVAALVQGELERSADAREAGGVEQVTCPRTRILTRQIKECFSTALPVFGEPIGRSQIRSEMLDRVYRSLPNEVALLAVGATVFGLMGHIDASGSAHFAIVIAAENGNGVLSPLNDEVGVREYLSSPMLAAWDLPDEYEGLLRHLEVLAVGAAEQILVRRADHALGSASVANAVCALMMQSPIVDEFVRSELAQRICDQCIDDVEASLRSWAEAARG